MDEQPPPGPPSGHIHVPMAKALPPVPPPSYVRRAELESRIGECLHHRLTTVVAGAGFGKSTLLAAWAADAGAAWYTLGRDDAAPTALARGILAALRVRIPDLPTELTTAATSSSGPDTLASTRGASLGAILAETLDEHTRGDIVLVLDDVDELPLGGAAAELVQRLCRQGPPNLHLVLSSRNEPPFRVQRLRGRGQVLALHGDDLAFSPNETRQLLTTLLGDHADRFTGPLQELTGGWPAAIRLAAEALRRTGTDDADDAMARLRTSGSSLFPYLVEEVFANRPPATRELVRRIAPLPRFTVELCRHLGIEAPGSVIDGLGRWGMLEGSNEADGWYALNGLVREYALAELPLDAEERTTLWRTAAGWMSANHHHVEALRCLFAAGDHAAGAELLRTRGRELVAAGHVHEVVKAVTDLPSHLHGPELQIIAGEARQVLGDWEGALACFHEAAGDQPLLPAGLAWRIGLIHHLRGEPDEALAAYGRGRIVDPDGRDEALLSAWTAAAHYIRGDEMACQEHAELAHRAAQRAGDPEALATSHTVLAMLAALQGDRRANDAHYLQALDAAESAGNVLLLARIHCNRGSRSLEEGAYEDAIIELERAIRLAEVTGFAAFHALALSNRGEARLALGRLEEATADYQAARDIYQRIGSAMVSYPLAGLGQVHSVRGDLALARAALEEAVDVAERAGDQQGLVPALAGLARVVAGDDPVLAEQLVRRAIAPGSGMAHVDALLGAGWVALAIDRRVDARAFAADAETHARRRRDRAGLAESLELRSLAAEPPSRDLTHLDQAAAIWRELGNPIGMARVALARTRLAAGPTDTTRDDLASDQLRALGVGARAAEAAGPLRSLTARNGPPVALRSLGAFRVLRDGTTAPVTDWQSRKARDLLKMLLARRGRPTSREVLMDNLWPGEDPGRLGNRLSGLLSTVRSVLDPDHRFAAEHLVVSDRGSVWLELDHLDIDVLSFLEAASAGLSLRRDGSAGAADVLRAAEAAYTGDFLEDDPYEEWATPLREEARAAYTAVTHALATDAVRSGDHDMAVRYCLRILERDPYDEGAHLDLVRSLVSAGRHGEAHRHYQLYAARMHEIGVESVVFPAEGSTGPRR